MSSKGTPLQSLNGGHPASRSALEERIASLYGERDWRRASGILHVAAIAEETHAVLAIGPHAPASATDRFVLGFARARADLLLTTGAILRSEPALVHRYAEDLETDQALRDWRVRVLGRSDAPGLIVMSRSGDLPLAHPALAAAESGWVWTSAAGRERLGSRVGRLEVLVGAVDGDSNGIADALNAVREEIRFDTVLVEAGPSTAAAFYAPEAGSGIRVDELLLSRFEGLVEPEASGPRFVSEAAIRSRFEGPPSSTRIEEPSGFWRFERYRDATTD